MKDRKSGSNKTRVGFRYCREIVISISSNGLLKSCARFVIEQSEIRKKQHDFKSVHFECRMVLFYIECRKVILCKLIFIFVASGRIGI